MKQNRLLILAFFSAFLLTACSTSQKACIDEICRVVDDGEVHYFGDREKVAVIEKAEAKKKEVKNIILSKIKKAPRKSNGEKIRIALVSSNVSRELRPYARHLLETLHREIKRHRGIEVISHRRFDRELGKRTVERKTNDPFKHPYTAQVEKLEKQNRSYKSPEEVVEEIQLLGMPVDVLTRVEIVSVGSELQFSANLTSAFSYEKTEHFDPLKISLSDIREKRPDVRGEKDAVQNLVDFIIKCSEALRKTMPAMAALEKIHQSSWHPANIAKETKPEALIEGVQDIFDKKSAAELQREETGEANRAPASIEESPISADNSFSEQSGEPTALENDIGEPESSETPSE